MHIPSYEKWLHSQSYIKQKLPGCSCVHLDADDNHDTEPVNVSELYYVYICVCLYTYI